MRVPFRKLWIAAIPVSLIFIIFINPCSDKIGIAPTFIISTLFLSAWTTQYSIAAGEIQGKWYEYPFYFIYNLCFLFLVSVPFAIFTPASQCYTDRSYVANALSSISPLKQEISSSLMAKKEIKYQEFENPSMFENVEYLEVQKDGNIFVLTRAPHTSIRLTPERSGDAIKWLCHGRPTKFVPAVCRR